MNISSTRRITAKARSLRNTARRRSVSTTSDISPSTNRTMPTWSENFSFASPESDFVSTMTMVNRVASDVHAIDQQQPAWSGNISFASPESDFVSTVGMNHSMVSDVSNQQQPSWSSSLSFSSPESDFVSAPKTLQLDRGRSEEVASILQELLENNYLLASPETATGAVACTEMLDETIKDIIMKRLSLKESLPKTMGEALKDERPILITTVESPFQVVDVNGAWEGLCGYSRNEAIGRNVGDLLQGPETNMDVAKDMIRSLREQGFSETILTNYTKTGRKFTNRVKIGMLPAPQSTNSNESFLVGVLYDTDESANEKLASL